MRDFWMGESSSHGHGGTHGWGNVLAIANYMAQRRETRKEGGMVSLG